MKNSHKRREQQKKKCRTIAMHLRQGTLTLSEVLELSEGELHAIAQVAEGLRRTGNHQKALTIYGMLAAVDPLNSKWWNAMADLHLSGGDHGLAVMCYETLALLQGREPEPTRREIQALQQLGAQQLAQELAQLKTQSAGTKEITK